jgi:diacylglycerol kinase family enzyme
MMSLKRSSNVRLALTRIFRSAGDQEEFKLSIENEAKKIVSHDDQEDLRIVKALSVNGFLEPVVALLWEEVF